jgi:hypothetical protein
MKKQYENWLVMYNATLTILMNFIADWQNSVSFSDSVNKFDTSTKTINTVRKKTETGSGGVTSKKNSTIEKLIDQTNAVDAALKAYFKKTDNTVELHKVKFTRSDFEKMRANKLILVAKEILGLAKDNFEVIIDYKITEPMLNELEVTINEFGALSTSPRIMISEGKVAREALAVLFKTANSILAQELDLMIVPYGKTNSEFFHAYMNARKVVQYGTRHGKGDQKDNNEGDNLEETK